MNIYIEQAEKFLKDTKTKFKVEYLKFDRYFSDDTEKRDIWKVRLTRNKKQFSFTFGQSIANQGKEPNPYDVLTCLEKYGVDTFENFCADFGYDNDSIKAHKVYLDVLKEQKGVNRLFSDVIEKLRDIE